MIIVGIMLLSSFMIADLAILPDTLKPTYLHSRLYMQVPLCIIFFVSSFHPIFIHKYQLILASVMLGIVYINFWLIVQCWKLEQFAFPYEGTIIYSLFSLFIFRMSFRVGIYYSLLVVFGFGLLCVSYPIYGANTGVYFGFVVVGSMVGLIGAHQVEGAVEKLFQANSNLSALSQLDPLTELYNRRTYEQRFTDLLNLCSRTQTTICVFIIDLDNFKDYNDGYGHLKGDDIIKLQAQHLRQIFRRDIDIIGRFGGEEFIIVTSQVTAEQCRKFAQTIIEHWAVAKIKHGKGSGGEYMSCSVGYHLEQVTLETTKKQMVLKADNALYRAKANGRNQFAEYVEG